MTAIKKKIAAGKKASIGTDWKISRIGSMIRARLSLVAAAKPYNTENKSASRYAQVIRNNERKAYEGSCLTERVETKLVTEISFL